MFEHLCRWMPPRVAAAVLVVWYILLIFAILWCWNADPAEFRYGNI